MSVPKIEDAKEVKVGASYRVPHVLATEGYFKGKLIPVNGPKHTDKEIGTPDEHLHIDYRFVSTPLWKRTQKRRVHPLAIILSVGRNTTGVIEYRQRKCQREAPHFPEWHGSRILEKSFVGAELKCGRCPHRNADLRGVLPADGGVVICPGHGLAFLDGKCVRRQNL